MDNHAFVADNFDNLKTLQRKERSLLGDMRVAFKDKDMKTFLKLLHRTNYKNENLQDFNAASKKRFTTWCGLAKYKTPRNLLFERDSNDKSLFEEILSRQGKGNAKFITTIWTECELWRSQDILLAVNPEGKQPIDYMIDSNDDGNFFAFLVFDFEQELESVTKSRNYYLKLKNMQYLEKTGKTIFQKIYTIIDENNEEICYNILKKLLKELRHVMDIQGETAIDDVLKMKSEIFKHKILIILFTYWKIYSKDYFQYKNILSEISPYYSLLFILKEGDEYRFEEMFQQYIEFTRDRWGKHMYVSVVRDEANALLEFALVRGQRKAITAIIDCPIVDPNQVAIKIDDESLFDNQNAHFIMSKLLERGLYLGNDNDGQHVPIDWISPQIFEDFLDSRVKEDGFHGCQIDYNFLLDPKIRDEKIKSDHDDNGRLLFSRGVKSIENILDQESLKTFITHPVLSTFINLKVRKFRMIFNLNFFIFIFLYVIPFYILLTLIPFKGFYTDIFKEYGEVIVTKSDRKIYKLFGLTFAQFFSLPIYACYIATTYLTCRECLQLFVVSDTLINYFKKKSNQFEITIIALSCFILYGLKKFSAADIKAYMTVPSALIIIFATVELLSILPYPSMSIYMFMLKQVTKTFMKFFTIFVLIIIAFTFSFCVVLKPPTNKLPSPWRQLTKDWNNYTATNNDTAFVQVIEPAVMFVNTLEDALEDNGTIFRNFENPFTSFQKTLLMLSGEYSIDPYTLDSVSKQLLFLFFVFTSFILFNLINGLAISDIQQLKEHAEFLNLKQQVRNASESEGVLCDVYWKVCQTSKTKHSLWRKCVMYIMSMLVRKYPYLHKMDNLCIDFKKKTVKYEWDQRQIHILRTCGGDTGKYTLDEETTKKLRGIVEKRQHIEEGINEKVERLEDQMRKLKLSLRSQHDEMKKLIEEFMQQKTV